MESTEPTGTQPSPAAPQHPIIDTPATIEACADDYKAGAATRAAIDDHVRRYGGGGH